MAILSILGLYEYDNSIFENVDFPDGLEKEDCIKAILLECSDLEFLYSAPDYAKISIELWARKHRRSWQKLVDTTLLQYNPIENYDRIEDWEDSKEGTGTATQTGTSDSENTHKVHGFEANAIVTAEIDSSNSSGETKSDSKTEESAKHSGRLHGNIGVTTTQEMIQQERNVALFNVIDIIVNSFKHELCILVY